MKTIIIILLLVLILGLGVWLGTRVRKRREGSLANAWQARTEKKKENKIRILEKMEKTGRITNDEVQELLRVSDATATNYLDELEKEGKIEQVGETGRGTFYLLKTAK